MKTIIDRPDRPFSAKTTCKDCKAVFTFEHDDIVATADGQSIVGCPNCSRWIGGPLVAKRDVRKKAAPRAKPATPAPAPAAATTSEPATSSDGAATVAAAEPANGEPAKARKNRTRQPAPEPAAS